MHLPGVARPMFWNLLSATVARNFLNGNPSHAADNSLAFLPYSKYQTVHASDGRPPPEWKDLVVYDRYATPIDDDCAIQLAEEWLTPGELAQRQDRHNLVPRSESSKETNSRPAAPPSPDSPLSPTPSGPVIDLTLPREGELPQTDIANAHVKFKAPPSTLLPPPVPPEPDPNKSKRVSFAPNASSSPLRRSKRIKTVPKRYVPEDFIWTYSQLLAKNLVAHSARVQ
jgi:hypothetical protein